MRKEKHRSGLIPEALRTYRDPPPESTTSSRPQGEPHLLFSSSRFECPGIPLLACSGSRPTVLPPLAQSRCTQARRLPYLSLRLEPRRHHLRETAESPRNLAFAVAGDISRTTASRRPTAPRVLLMPPLPLPPHQRRAESIAAHPLPSWAWEQTGDLGTVARLRKDCAAPFGQQDTSYLGYMRRSYGAAAHLERSLLVGMTWRFAIAPGPETQVSDPGNNRCSCQHRPSHEQPQCSAVVAESVLSHCPPYRAVMLGLGGKTWGSSSHGRAGHSAFCEHWSRPWPREAGLPTPSLGGKTTPKAESDILPRGRTRHQLSDARPATQACVRRKIWGRVTGVRISGSCLLCGLRRDLRLSCRLRHRLLS